MTPFEDNRRRPLKSSEMALLLIEMQKTGHIPAYSLPRLGMPLYEAMHFLDEAGYEIDDNRIVEKKPKCSG